MKISKEFKVGLLGIISLGILYFGFNYLKGINLFENTSHYYALYENIDGLTVSNPVIINGLNVGRVNHIDILQDKSDQILVELNVDGDIKLRKGTKAKLINTDFLGSKAIELIISDVMGEYYQTGDTLPSEVDPGITEFLKQSAAPVAANLGITITRLNAILENFKGNSEVINKTLRNIEGMTATLDRDLPAMQHRLIVLLDNLNNNSEELSQMMADIKPLLQNTTQITDSIKALEFSAMMDKTQQLLDNMNANLESLKEGQGTMGKLMKDDSLYLYLSYTARDLDRLLVDFQANPQRYVQFSVFGKKDKSEKDAKKKKRKEEKSQ